VLPQAATPEDERPILDRWLSEQSGPMAYRYLPEYLAGIDPRAQTEDVGDDPVAASTYAIANLKKVVPNLVAWTTRPGEDYDDLAELYGEAVQMWTRYMGHVTTLVGGMTVDLKTADQAGAVYRPVPKARQKAALAFLAENAIRTPSWLEPEPILSRIGPREGSSSLVSAQTQVLSLLLDVRRLARLADVEDGYPLGEYMDDLRRAVWGTPGTGAAPDANRRTLQRVYLERLGAIVSPPPPPANAQQQQQQQARFRLPTILQPPNVPRSDLPAVARAQLRIIRDAARRGAASTSGVTRAHWLDVADRVGMILEPRGR
jgi:hypothetical protein